MMALTFYVPFINVDSYGGDQYRKEGKSDE
jgi:hypothetical protein